MYFYINSQRKKDLKELDKEDIGKEELDKEELDKEKLDKENDLPVVKKCCPHGQQLTEDHRSCSAVRNGKANLPPRYGSPTFAQLRYTIT